MGITLRPSPNKCCKPDGNQKTESLASQALSLNVNCRFAFRMITKARKAGPTDPEQLNQSQENGELLMANVAKTATNIHMMLS